MRDKLVSLIQENAARIKRTTTKFTGNNKKHTLEHWQALFDSYDKIFRSLPRDLLRVEREVRVKFVSPLTEVRVTRLKTMINSEAEILIQKRAKEYRPQFDKLGQVIFLTNKCNKPGKSSIKVWKNKFKKPWTRSTQNRGRERSSALRIS